MAKQESRSAAWVAKWVKALPDQVPQKVREDVSAFVMEKQLDETRFTEVIAAGELNEFGPAHVAKIRKWWQNVLSEKDFAAQAKENLATNRQGGKGIVIS